MDRKQACKEYSRTHPHAEFGLFTHVVVSDLNIEDYFIYGAIRDVAAHLYEHDDDVMAKGDLRFLVGLLDLPLPDGWSL